MPYSTYKRRIYEPGYFAEYGGCLHPIPHCEGGTGCTCSQCGEGCTTCNIYKTTIPTKTATFIIRKYDAPLANAEVFLVNANETRFLSLPNLRTNQNGEITFIPPKDLRLAANNSFKLAIIYNGVKYITNNIYEPPTANTVYNNVPSICPRDLPALTSPANNAQYANGSIVPFSWGAVPGATKFYWVIVHENDTSLTVYDVGTTRSLSVAVNQPGTWYWYVAAFNASNQIIAESDARSFVMTTGTSQMGMPMNISTLTSSYDDGDDVVNGFDLEVEDAVDSAVAGVTVMSGEEQLFPLDDSEVYTDLQDVGIQKAKAKKINAKINAIEYKTIVLDSLQTAEVDQNTRNNKVTIEGVTPSVKMFTIDPLKNINLRVTDNESTIEHQLLDLFISPYERMYYQHIYGLSDVELLNLLL
jgi:hypothetical protein